MQDNTQAPVIKRVLTLFIDERGDDNIVHFEYSKYAEMETVADLIRQLVLATKTYAA